MRSFDSDFGVRIQRAYAEKLCMHQKQKDQNERTTTEQNPGSCDTDSQEKDHTIGTLGGEEDHVVRARKGEPVPGDTDDQGGGQN